MCIVGDRLRHCVLFPFSRKHEAALRRAGLKETYAIVQSDEQALSGMYKQTKGRLVLWTLSLLEQ